MKSPDTSEPGKVGKFLFNHLYWLRIPLTICPGIDYLNPDPFKVVHISCCDRRFSTFGYRRYLAVGMVYRTPGGSSSRSYHGVGLGCGTVKG